MLETVSRWRQGQSSAAWPLLLGSVIWRPTLDCVLWGWVYRCHHTPQAIYLGFGDLILYLHAYIASTSPMGHLPNLTGISDLKLVQSTEVELQGMENICVCVCIPQPPYTWFCPLKSHSWIKFDMYMYFLLKKIELSVSQQILQSNEVKQVQVKQDYCSSMIFITNIAFDWLLPQGWPGEPYIRWCVFGNAESQQFYLD